MFSYTENPKKLSRPILISIALMAVTMSLGITPLLASGADSKTPTLTVVPGFSSVTVNGGTDFTVYVQVPNNPPASGTFYDLQPAFVVQSISYSTTEPNGTVSPLSTVVTCATKKGGGYPGYPSRVAETSCTGIYEQRVDPRAYWGSNTAIYFLGLVGFSPTGTWTVTFTVTGLYYSNTLTLTASTQLQVGTTASGAAMTSSKSLSAAVVPAASSFPLGSGTDFTIYVQVPNNPPVSGTFYDLQPAFVVQSISQGETEPNGTVQPPSTVVTCTTAATNKYPGYPSRGAETSCSGFYEQRVDPRTYWGSNTGIYFLGLVFFGPAGTYTETFVITGLYYGSSITLTATTQVKVGSTS